MSKELMATTISLDPETRDLLRAFGRTGESDDEIIRRLIEDAGWARPDDRWNQILETDEFIPLEDL